MRFACFSLTHWSTAICESSTRRFERLGPIIVMCELIGMIGPHKRWIRACWESVSSDPVAAISWFSWNEKLSLNFCLFSRWKFRTIHMQPANSPNSQTPSIKLHPITRAQDFILLKIYRKSKRNFCLLGTFSEPSRLKTKLKVYKIPNRFSMTAWGWYIFSENSDVP